jgi:hypothetical protein
LLLAQAEEEGAEPACAAAVFWAAPLPKNHHEKWEAALRWVQTLRAEFLEPARRHVLVVTACADDAWSLRLAAALRPTGPWLHIFWEGNLLVSLSECELGASGVPVHEIVTEAQCALRPVPEEMPLINVYNPASMQLLAVPGQVRTPRAVVP